MRKAFVDAGGVEVPFVVVSAQANHAIAVLYVTLIDINNFSGFLLGPLGGAVDVNNLFDIASTLSDG